ncbi:uncharacterized protein [Aquarana catesbeiana]|uniref:uncharacterized protein n=1 Tax=Aquarana catesbeiana TaxID=8400 RepID=UPI003CC9D098
MVDKFTAPAFLPKFIEKYRELSCLWQVKCRDYSNKIKRKEAMEKLLEIVKPVYPMADINYLKAKIGGLRSTYNRERKKVLDSQRSGASADDVYVPRLWYYNSLRFLTDQEDDEEEEQEEEEDVKEPSLTQVMFLNSQKEKLGKTPGLSIYQKVPSSNPDQTEGSLKWGIEESLSQEEGVASSLTESQVPPLRPPSKRAMKSSNLDDAMVAFLRKATAAISTAPDGQEAFGCLTGNKLKQMEEDQRTMCEEIILQALNKGTRGELTRKTHLCELDHAPPPTPQPPHPPQQHDGPWPMQPHPQHGHSAGDYPHYN